MTQSLKLRRSLGLPLVTLYGLGNILGAGIYVLVGKVAGEAGSGTLIAFLVAMVAAALTAFTYMELSSRYPVSASASVYTYNAFKNRRLSILIGLAMVAGGITSAAALSQGFAGYLQSFISIPVSFGSVAIILLLGCLAYIGVSESAKAAALFTIIEITGLVVLIWFGSRSLDMMSAGSFFTVDTLAGSGGILAGAFLAFYAFIGFEDMVNVAEETKNPSRTMPLAILYSLIISTILYIAVAAVAIASVPIAELSESKAPLTLVLEKNGVQSATMLSVIGMAATINGVIVQIIMGSRILYGLAKQGWIPVTLAALDRKHHTPKNATIAVVLAMLAGTLILPLVSLAQLTSYIVLSIFTIVNASLIVIKRRGDVVHGKIKVPIAVPYSAIVLCVSMIMYQLITSV